MEYTYPSERTSGYSARRAASVTLPTACMAAGHPLCGILNAVSVRDEDSFCIQFVHRSASLGTLRLLNSSILDTVSTKLPSHILPNESGWWAVRDGVVWQATGGVKTDSCTVHPFTISAWFGADCLSCPHRVVESPHYRIHLSLTLRHGVSASGRYNLETTVARSHHELPEIESDARFTNCSLLVKVMLRDRSTQAPPVRSRPLLTEATTPHTVFPCDPDPGSWCDQRQSTAATEELGQYGGTGGTTPGIDLRSADSSCEELAQSRAVNVIHVRYFLKQQQAERELLDRAERCLCDGLPSSDGPSVDDASFQARLELLLRPWRMATRLHIHTAFVAKQVCAMNAEIDRRRAMRGQREDMLQLPTCELPTPRLVLHR